MSSNKKEAIEYSTHGMYLTTLKLQQAKKVKKINRTQTEKELKGQI